MLNLAKVTVWLVSTAIAFAPLVVRAQLGPERALDEELEQREVGSERREPQEEEIVRRGVRVRDENRRFSKGVRSWVQLKQQNVVMQQRDYSCGAAALATIARYYWGDPVNENFFLVVLDHILTREEAEDRVENGLAMTDLRRAAVRVGYTAVVGRLSFEKLGESKVPLIVGITVGEYDHFVVYRGMDGLYVYLADPIRGNLRIPNSVFIEQWQKNAVLAIAKKDSKIKEYSRLSIRGEELFLGWINDQVVRTAGERPFTRPLIGRKVTDFP